MSKSNTKCSRPKPDQAGMNLKKKTHGWLLASEVADEKGGLHPSIKSRSSSSMLPLDAPPPAGAASSVRLFKKSSRSSSSAGFAGTPDAVITQKENRQAKKVKIYKYDLLRIHGGMRRAGYCETFGTACYIKRMPVGYKEMSAWSKETDVKRTTR